MAFKMDCPHCMRTLNVTETAMGKTIPCPGCHQPVAVPRESPPVHPMHQVEPHGYAIPVAQASPVASLPPPLVPPGITPVSRPESTELETGTCTYCRRAMALDAVKCSSCGNWRRDIHELIDDDRRLAIAQINALIIGTILAGISFAAAVVGATTETLSGRNFSSERFFASPWFAVGVVIAIAVVVMYIITLTRAGQIKQRIHTASRGLWEHPWWASPPSRRQ